MNAKVTFANCTVIEFTAVLDAVMLMQLAHAYAAAEGTTVEKVSILGY